MLVCAKRRAGAASVGDPTASTTIAGLRPCRRAADKQPAARTSVVGRRLHLGASGLGAAARRRSVARKLRLTQPKQCAVTDAKERQRLLSSCTFTGRRGRSRNGPSAFRNLAVHHCKHPRAGLERDFSTATGHQHHLPDHPRTAAAAGRGEASWYGGTSASLQPLSITRSRPHPARQLSQAPAIGEHHAPGQPTDRRSRSRRLGPCRRNRSGDARPPRFHHVARARIFSRCGRGQASSAARALVRGRRRSCSRALVSRRPVGGSRSRHAAFFRLPGRAVVSRTRRKAQAEDGSPALRCRGKDAQGSSGAQARSQLATAWNG